MISLNLEENIKFIISSIYTLTTHSNKEINSLQYFILFFYGLCSLIIGLCNLKHIYLVKKKLKFYSKFIFTDNVRYYFLN